MIDITKRIKDSVLRQVARYKESKEYQDIVLKATLEASEKKVILDKLNALEVSIKAIKAIKPC